jgi:hypothetical protein
MLPPPRIELGTSPYGNNVQSVRVARSTTELQRHASTLGSLTPNSVMFGLQANHRVEH